MFWLGKGFIMFWLGKGFIMFWLGKGLSLFWITLIRFGGVHFDNII